MSDTNPNAPLIPRFDEIKVDLVSMPYDPAAMFLKTSFSDPILSGYEVTVVADSISPEGEEHFSGADTGESDRLVTIVARFPRAVLSELNTHRVFSRNSASSRARSIRTTITDVMENPFIPLFTNNQRGMSGRFVSSGVREKAVAEWLAARDSAVAHTLRMLLVGVIPEDVSNEDMVADYTKYIDLYYSDVYHADDHDALSLHKQDVNRLLEPFSWHEAVISSTYWDNFLELRTDLDNAYPPIVALALLIERALSASSPEVTAFHVPFVPASKRPKELWATESVFDGFVSETLATFMLSSMESAQVSFKDKSTARSSNASAQRGYELLENKHLSPFEHVAIRTDVVRQGAGAELTRHELASNFSEDWCQLRSLLTNVEGITATAKKSD